VLPFDQTIDLLTYDDGVASRKALKNQIYGEDGIRNSNLNDLSSSEIEDAFSLVLIEFRALSDDEKNVWGIFQRGYLFYCANENALRLIF